jgi:hypothetical protein
MREGTVLSPLNTRPLSAMMTSYLFGSYRIWGEPKRRGKKPRERSGFLNISIVLGKFPFLRIIFVRRERDLLFFMHP